MKKLFYIIVCIFLFACTKPVEPVIEKKPDPDNKCGCTGNTIKIIKDSIIETQPPLNPTPRIFKPI